MRIMIDYFAVILLPSPKVIQVMGNPVQHLCDDCCIVHISHSRNKVMDNIQWTNKIQNSRQDDH